MTLRPFVAQIKWRGDVFVGSTMKVDYIRAYTRKDGYNKFRNNLRAWDENEFKNKE